MSGLGGMLPAVSLLEGILDGLTGGAVKSLPLVQSGVASQTLQTGRGIETLGGIYQSYSALYRTQPWVHIVVNKLARGVARLPLRTIEFVDDSDTERRVLRDHDFHRLLLNPWPGGTSFGLKEAIVGSLAVHGHSLVAKYRPGPGRSPAELWPLKWQYVTPVAGEDRPIGLYRYRGPEGRADFLPEDVIHFSWWGPEGVGVSPLEPLRRTLMLEEGAQRYSINSFRNGARPSGALTTEQKMNKTERAELREEIEAAHSGVDQAFRMALLSGGLSWTAFSHNAVEAEVINLRKLTREEVAAAYDIPPPVIHILDRATFSNIDEQHRMWYQDTLAPILEMLTETMLVQAILPERSYGQVFPEFDLSDVLKADPDKQTTAQQRRFQSGTRTPNELRAEDRLPPIGDPDDPANPANQVYVPANMIAVNGEAPEEVVDPPAAPAGILEAMSRQMETLTTLLLSQQIDKAANGNGGGHSDPAMIAALMKLAERRDVLAVNPTIVAPNEDVDGVERVTLLLSEEIQRAREEARQKTDGVAVIEREVEYGDDGLAVRIKEMLADGTARAYAVARDDSGRMVGLTKEE